MNTEMFEMLDLVLVYLYDKIPQGISRSRILKEVFDGDLIVPLDAILLHLESEGHIYLTMCGNSYSPTIRGMEFIRNSSIPNRPYQCKENRRLQDLRDIGVSAKLAKKADWPKRNWIAMLLITFFLGIVSTLSAEFLKKKLFPTTATPPPTPSCKPYPTPPPTQ